jgi:hypothetical protein
VTQNDKKRHKWLFFIVQSACLFRFNGFASLTRAPFASVGKKTCHGGPREAASDKETVVVHETILTQSSKKKPTIRNVSFRHFGNQVSILFSHL